METNYNVKDVYDKIYKTEPKYNFPMSDKNEYVDNYIKGIKGSILDAGCGQGNNIKRLLGKGYDVFGIELSKQACDKYLQDVPHKNIDIISYANTTTRKYDGTICNDVLEHIPPEEIDSVLECLKKLSNGCLIGIANHSDIHQGYQLHLIIKNETWWNNKLKEHFSNVSLIKRLGPPSFYFFEVS